MTAPRTARVVFCWDCGYVGNRWETVKDTILGGTGWTEVEWNACPECGEPCGPDVEVVECPSQSE